MSTSPKREVFANLARIGTALSSRFATSASGVGRLRLGTRRPRGVARRAGVSDDAVIRAEAVRTGGSSAERDNQGAAKQRPDPQFLLLCH